MPDFTAHRHPVIAVACPTCGAGAGAWCKRPSGHRAQGLHAARGDVADVAFVAQYGFEASIERLPGGQWAVNPKGLARAPAPRQLDFGF